MHVELVDYTKDKPQVFGIVKSEQGQLLIEGNVPKRIRDSLAVERAATAVSDSTFLKNLARTFSGSYLQARFVK